jgi:quercetin dioxygenase-like cupin family protein
MSPLLHLNPIVAILAAGTLAACSEDPPVAPTVPHTMGMDVAAATLEPFTFRAALEPYHVQQLPGLLIHSKDRTDVVMQRAVFAVGAGMWHTHPGPSYVYVIEGEIKVERFTGQDGCSETPVRGPGEAYMELGDQVHRAVVTSAQPAVLLVTRLNVPVGGAFTIPAADPGC